MKFGVAEDVVHRVGGADVAGLLADDDGQLGLALEDRGRHVGQHHRVAVADDRARRLWKALIGAGALRVPSSM